MPVDAPTALVFCIAALVIALVSAVFTFIESKTTTLFAAIFATIAGGITVYAVVALYISVRGGK